MSTIGKELGAAIADASTCVFNILKKKDIRMGLVDVVIDGSGKHLPEDKWPEFISNDDTGFTISQVEKIIADNFEECEGLIFKFRFHLQKTESIFKGDIEIIYEQEDDEKFIPVVYLGSKPKVK